jgi:4-amino-4-deoxy-L-arabinose transferase-like glycosyltransferase
MKKNTLAILFFIFVLAFLLRVLYLPQNALSFYYDQARDAFIVKQILSGDLKILGPPSSTPGLFHGVLYYYILAPAYWLGAGNPTIVAYWTAFLNSATVFIIYYFAYLLTKKRAVGLLGAFLFAISFEATQYAAWLSNPTLAVWSVPLIYLGLWMWLKEKKPLGPIISAIGLGVSIQAEIFLGYHIFPIILWLWIEKKSLLKKDVIRFIAILFAILSSLILAEIKFGFKGFSGIASLLSEGDMWVKGKEVGDYIILYLNQIGRTFSDSLLPSNSGYGGALGIGLIWYALRTWKRKKGKIILTWQPFLLTYLLAHLPIVSLGGLSTPHLSVGIGVAAITLAAIVLSLSWPKRKWLVVLIFVAILFSNISTILSENKKGQTVFTIQNDMILSNQLKVVDYTYQKANGNAFSINSLTVPLWINTTWSYLYNWYGLEKYGYLPEWQGRDQVGRLGNNLPDALADTKLHFFIKEPPQGIPKLYQESEAQAEEARSKLVEEVKFGDLVVQQRIMEEPNE